MDLEILEFGGEDWGGGGGGEGSMFSAKKVPNTCAVGLESQNTVIAIDFTHTLSLGM